MAARQRARAAGQRVPADQPATASRRCCGGSAPAPPSSSSCGCAPPAATRRSRPRARCARTCCTAEPGPVCGPPLDRRAGDRLLRRGPAAAAQSRPRSAATSRTAASTTPTAFEAELPGERRTLHLGVDVFLPAGEPILAPLDGVVRDVAFRPARATGAASWCSTTRPPDGDPLPHALRTPRPRHRRAAHTRRRAPRGDVVGRLGDERENGGWAPHLHLQLLTTDLGRGCDAHGVGTLAERDLWESVSPDPNLLLGLRGGVRAEPPRDAADLRAAAPHLDLARAEPRLRRAAADRPRRGRAPLRRRTAAPTSTWSTTSATSATPTRASSRPPPSRWRG